MKDFNQVSIPIDPRQAFRLRRCSFHVAERTHSRLQSL